ncbi:hypothetical protein KKF84_17350 [Myxococcota bacterium]|nr:hypothetical protein [Myxococcota bacterium]MBU1537094.1 hypothetical protein [Myxococcota bacterium]
MPVIMALLILFGLPTATKKKTRTRPKLVIKETPVKIDAYKGVAPPSPKVPDIIPKPGKTCMLVWPGFQSHKKTRDSRFFFLFTSKINLKYSKVTVKNNHYLRLIVTNCHAWSKNAWRDIITHYFSTPVEKVSFYRHEKKNDMIIDVEFKKGIVMPKMSHTNFMGYYLLLLEWSGKK